jgi:hypothetical protein
VPDVGCVSSRTNLGGVWGIESGLRLHAPHTCYAQLAELIYDKEVNIRNKLARGKFTAAFLLQSLAAIGQTDLRLG